MENKDNTINESNSDKEIFQEWLQLDQCLIDPNHLPARIEDALFIAWKAGVKRGERNRSTADDIRQPIEDNHSDDSYEYKEGYSCGWNEACRWYKKYAYHQAPLPDNYDLEEFMSYYADEKGRIYEANHAACARALLDRYKSVKSDESVDRESLMSAIVKTGQEAGIVRSDLETVSVSECLHILKCLTDPVSSGDVWMLKWHWYNDDEGNWEIVSAPNYGGVGEGDEIALMPQRLFERT